VKKQSSTPVKGTRVELGVPGRIQSGFSRGAHVWNVLNHNETSGVAREKKKKEPSQKAKRKGQRKVLKEGITGDTGRGTRSENAIR